MRKRVLIFVSSLVAATLVSTAAFSFELLNPARRWFPGDLPKNVIVDNRGLDSVTDGDGGVSAALGAVKEWNTAPGGVTLNILSSSAGSPNGGLGDGLSHLVFGDPFRICKGQCLAVTLTGFFDDGQTATCDGLDVVRITDSDIFFNTRHKFTTEAEEAEPGAECSRETFLEAVVTHEVGHLIGLAHSGEADALMAPTISSCDPKGLNDDDTDGRDALYECVSFVECTITENPEVTCNDGLDNDCDGLTDGADPDCGVECTVTEDPEVSCNDGLDNDCDELIDGDDPDCGVCELGVRGDPCGSDAECCSLKCRGKPGAKTCK